MVSLVIGAGGLLLVIGGLFAILVWAAGEDAGAMLAIILGSVVFTVIVVLFAVLFSNGLEEVFFSTNE